MSWIAWPRTEPEPPWSSFPVPKTGQNFQKPSTFPIIIKIRPVPRRRAKAGVVKRQKTATGDPQGSLRRPVLAIRDDWRPLGWMRFAGVRVSLRTRDRNGSPVWSQKPANARNRFWTPYHCLKKFQEALFEYQKEIKCSKAEVESLYKQFKNVLQTSTSKLVLEIKIGLLDNPSFKHPLLKKRIDELEANAVYYTAHMSRKGIAPTTSIVDNFLKTVKRKLRSVESFRDKPSTQALFRAMANTRNFVPFLSGAKNAYQSPFMMAEGQTFGLPWIQVMNIHNAFLFTEDAF